MHFTFTNPSTRHKADNRTDSLRPTNRPNRVALPPKSGFARVWLALLLAGFAFAAAAQANPFYVSPSGNDNAPGTQSQPFRTIERARSAARAAAASQSKDIVVYLRGGRYELNQTLQFDGNDSGRNGYRTIYRAYPGERPFISGGVRISGWSHYRDGIYRASSPLTLYRQLYIDGKPGIRARTPNHGYHRLTRWNGDKTITVPSSHVSNWSNLNDVEMVVMKHWNQSRLRIGSLHNSGGSTTIVPREPERSVEWLVEWPNREPNQSYHFENSLDFLDEPGEWYLDRHSRTVYYMPRPGENMQTAEIVAPRLERLLDVRGASNLQFEGITFEHCTWNDPSNEGFIGIQASSLRVLTTGELIPSAIYFESTNNVRFENNVVRNMGTNGIELAYGTNQTRITGNAIADLSGGGILVYTLLSNRYPPEHQRSRGDRIRNNYITRIGQEYTGAVGIYASYTDGAIIENNELYDLPYTAINIGWGWSNADTAARNNLVRYNRIHNVMNLMDDGAGIYTLSKQPGTIIEENYISHLVRNSWAGYYEIAGLYLDEQSEGFTMRHNVVRNLSGVLVFKQNHANSNTVHNNGDGIPNQQSIIDRAGLESSYRHIRDLVGNVTAPSPSEGPYSGSPAAIPGKIEAENFDHGGPGVAYHDSVNFNQGGQFRLADQVDIENTADTGGGFNVGYIEPGEWLQYTVKIAATGNYDFRFRVSSIYSGRIFKIAVDGKDVSPAIQIPNTGDWQNWQTISVSGIPLEAGTRKLRLKFDTGGLNLNWFEAAASPNPAPTVAISSPASGTEFSAGTPVQISANAEIANGSIVRVEFFANGQKIGEKNTAPFAFSWNGAKEGTHVLTARATSDTGETATSAPVQIAVAAAPAQGPFHGSPAAIPGIVTMVEYDFGGPGVAYHDTTAANQGGAFRQDQVDIEPSVGEKFSHNIGWVAAGEWLHYTVNVAESGSYEIDFRVASMMTSGHFKLQINGQDITPRINVPNTGDWQNWTTVSASNVQLPAGKQTLRLLIGNGEFNIGSAEFRRVAEHGSGAFANWQQGFFSPQEIGNENLSGPTADADGDGVANLLEYAFNRDPRQASRDNLPEPGSIEIDGKEYLTITYIRTVAASDLEYVPEASPDMKTWTASGLVEVSATREGDIERVVVRDSKPLRESPNRFLRVRVKKLTS